MRQRARVPPWSLLPRIALSALALLAAPTAGLAQERPTDVASYQIQARWLEPSKQIDGSETITYRNTSSDTLSELYLKLYLNAFRSPDTLWFQERGTQGYDPTRPGWTRVERLTLQDGTDLLAGASLDETETVMRVPLPRPLGPGESLRLRVEWLAQLPRSFARTGFSGDFVFAGQWYPKLAVYDPRRGGWDREPWHGNAEFFADFGSYDLELTLPVGRVVAASGVPLGERDNADGTRTARFRAERVTDVAWFAGPGLVSQERQVGATTVAVYAPTALAHTLPRYFDATTLALERFGAWYGAYPWPRLAVLVPPAEASGVGGMEYPTLVTSEPPVELPFGLGARVYFPEVVTVHEVAHQWFPMQVQSNEAREPWLDEGFADYLATRALEARYGASSSFIDLPFARFGYRHLHHLSYSSSAATAIVARPAWEYGSLEYGTAVYSKGSLVLRTLQGYLGEEVMLRAMRLYMDRWRWGHPTTDDFVAALEEASDQDLDPLLQPLLHGTETVEYTLESVEAQPEEGGYQARVSLRRPGEIALPVAVRLRFADGSERRLVWDARENQVVLTARSEVPLVSATANPSGELALELNPLDNSLAVGPAPEALGAAVRWLAMAQWLARLVGLFG